jgi:hypothetical protein
LITTTPALLPLPLESVEREGGRVDDFDGSLFSEAAELDPLLFLFLSFSFKSKKKKTRRQRRLFLLLPSSFSFSVELPRLIFLAKICIDHA